DWLRRDGTLTAILHGAPGTGKTHLGYALCRVFAHAGQNALLQSAQKVLAEIRATWDPASRERQEQVITRFATLDLLVIDEPDKVHWSENTRQLFFAILDRRYAQALPTVVLTNATTVTLSGLTQTPIWRRLREHLLVLDCGEHSYRAQ
ncbi:ATP-binding protein, partial [Acidithiobacillus sp. MC6.1]|nr:ATP-binding protein [Acidithiobacillus sp. MC6.1]